MSTGDLVVVGGGLAAVRTAQAVRDLGFDGRIVLLSEEAELPYDRPPLSKEVLLGTFPDDALRLLDAEAYADLGVDVRLGHRAVGLDPAACTVQVEGHPAVPYGTLVVATGSRPRRLDAIADAADVHHVRTADDSRALAAALVPGAEVVIVGAGFIGLEVASCAVALGCRVTVVEAAAQPLSHALGPEVATWLQERHAAAGVTFRCGVTVTAEDAGRREQRLHLSDGSTLPADVVVVGVGVVRDTAWLSDAGLEVRSGLVCDVDGRTSVPGVYGAGDVVLRAGPAGATLIGHWTAAADSAVRAARAITGADPLPATDEAFFWSNQAGLRIQAVGHYAPGAVTTVVDGELATGSFVAHYEVDGALVGVVAANSPRPFLAGRKALRERAALLAG